MLLAGAARVPLDITDVLPFDGFDCLDGELMVRALVMEGRDGSPSRTVLVSVDATSLKDVLVEELRALAAGEAGTSPVNVWVSATHSFSVPHVRTPDHIGQDERAANVALAEAYVGAVRTACREAAAQLREVRPDFARGSARLGVCRDVETPNGWWLGRDERGFSSSEVPVLALMGAKGPVALVFAADVQPAATKDLYGEGGSRPANPDLAGVACAELERRHSGCVALWLEGTAGDQAPALRGEEPQTYAEGQTLAHALGSELADAVDGALAPLAAQGATPACQEESLVCVREQAIELPGQVRMDFHSLGPSRTWRSEPAAPMATTLSILHIGPATLVGVRPELSSSLGDRLRHAIPDALVATLVNGGDKYLPDDDAYFRGTYEAMNSGFGPGSADRLLSLITSLAKKHS